MTKSLKKIKLLSLPVAAFGLLLLGGGAAKVSAQNDSRDPFAKPNGGRVASPSAPSSSSSRSTSPAEKPKPAAPTVVVAPPIQDRIAYYKRLREQAAMNNQPIPNPTVVMTLDELSVSGIFQSARGYAAIVEAKPIKLSYTVYPGDKFFDGQLVAVEENRLVFKKVTKMTNGKFIASEENKALREYTVDQQVQGTAPIEPSGRTESAANSAPAETPADPMAKPAKTVVVSSPLDEMNRQPEESKDSAKSKSDKKGSASNSKKPTKTKTASNSKSSRKPVKVAANTL